MKITPMYGAVLAILFVALSVRTVRLRRRNRIAVGDGGNVELMRAMRVHANFAEYVPMTLLLIYMLESMTGISVLVHGLSVCLVAGRIAHAYGVSQVSENYRYRVFGMAMTFAALVGAALGILLTGALGIVT